MFDITFMGHQGWAFRTPETCVLVDSLLSDGMGHGIHQGKVWPPRDLDIARFPRIDAYVCSHEHADHFDIPSLNLLDRKVPIVIPERTSIAASAVLGEMGFTVTRVAPGDVLRVGDIEVHFFSPDHTVYDNVDEWDVLPFVVRDTHGHGTFACGVDVAVPPGVLGAMVDLVGRNLGVWGFTANSMHWGFRSVGAREVPFDTVTLVGKIVEWYADASHRGFAPRAIGFCGSGISFEGDVEWLNRNCFPIDLDRAVRALEPLFPETAFMHGTPGETIRMVDGRIAGIEPRQPWLGAPPRAGWPNRELVGDVVLQTTSDPFTGVRGVDEAELPEIEAALDDFASFLYATDLFRQIYSMSGRRLAGKKPTMAVVLLDGDGSYVFEYEPRGCRFVAVECGDPTGEYASGFEMWASDLLAVARGEIEITSVLLGRLRQWNARPSELNVGSRLLSETFSPLRRPEMFLRLYRNALARQPTNTPRIAAGGAPLSVVPRA